MPLPQRSMARIQLRQAITQMSLASLSKSMLFVSPVEHHHELLQSTAPKLENSQLKTLKYQLLHIGQNAWRFSLFKNGYFVAYLCAIVPWISCYYSVFAFLPDRAHLMGFTSLESSLLLSVIGINSAIGRIVFGIVCDLPAVRPHRIYFFALSFIVCGLATSLSFMTSLPAQMVYATVYGLFVGKS